MHSILQDIGYIIGLFCPFSLGLIMSLSLEELATLIQGTVYGDVNTTITGLSAIDDIMPNSLIFAEGADNIQLAESSTAAAVLVNQATHLNHKPYIQVSHPFQAFIKLLNHFNPLIKPTLGIHPTAVIGDNVELGKDIAIGPYVVIESGSKIGDRCILKGHIHIGHNVHISHDSVIHPHVTLYDNCEIGARVIIHASTVIGSDGFGYTFVNGQHLKVPHIGKVVIEDDVEIGANTAIDRATVGKTVLGQGTKIDNLVQIAHSVKLGKHNILCGFTGIAGSTTSGNHVIFAANVGVSDHVTIEDGVILGARTGVPPKKHLKQGTVYLGSPAKPKDIAIKQELSTNRIPLMRKQIKTLMEKVALLEKKLTEQEVN